MQAHTADHINHNLSVTHNVCVFVLMCVCFSVSSSNAPLMQSRRAKTTSFYDKRWGRTDGRRRLPSIIYAYARTYIWINCIHLCFDKESESWAGRRGRRGGGAVSSCVVINEDNSVNIETFWQSGDAQRINQVAAWSIKTKSLGKGHVYIVDESIRSFPIVFMKIFILNKYFLYSAHWFLECVHISKCARLTLLRAL